MRSEALALLDGLSAEQRAAVTFAFGDAEREQWFYTPTDHGGLPLALMSPIQQQLVFKLLAAGLSPAGYSTVCTIMGLENLLDGEEAFRITVGWRERWRDPGLYYISLFGDPDTGTWACRVGGHHVSLHWTFVDGSLVSTTPFFFGADPATTRLVGGTMLRPLGAYEDLGRELVLELGDIAVVSSNAPYDIAGANRPHLSEGDGPKHVSSLLREDLGPHDPPAVNDVIRLSRSAAGVGLDSVGKLAQKLVDAYLEQLPEHHRPQIDAKRMQFAWAGGVEPGEPHYYRLQDEKWVIEYDNVQRDVNHIHTVVREWDGDFGHDVLSAHHAIHHGSQPTSQPT